MVFTLADVASLGQRALLAGTGNVSESSAVVAPPRLVNRLPRSECAALELRLSAPGHEGRLHAPLTGLGSELKGLALLQ